MGISVRDEHSPDYNTSIVTASKQTYGLMGGVLTLHCLANVKLLLEQVPFEHVLKTDTVGTNQSSSAFIESARAPSPERAVHQCFPSVQLARHPSSADVRAPGDPSSP
jgi:hypothetical protein